MNESALFNLLFCFLFVPTIVLNYILLVNLNYTNAINVKQSTLQTGPCKVNLERECEKLCFNGTCQLNIVVIASNSTDSANKMNLNNVMPVFKLAERDIRFEGLIPNEININWYQYDDNSTSSLATISTIYGYSTKCAHVFFGPTFDYPLASAGRIVKYLGYAGTPLLTVGGLSHDFQDTKNSCMNDYYMTIKVGMIASKEISQFLLQIIRRFEWNKILFMFESNGQKEIAGKHTCYLMMKALKNYLKVEPNMQTDSIDLEVAMNNSNIKDILAKHIGVIYPVTIMCVDVGTVRKIMLAAQELNMTNSGEYIFFNIVLDNNKIHLQPWLENNETMSNPQRIRDAYSALMTLKGQSPPSDRFDSFSRRLLDMIETENQTEYMEDTNKSTKEISPTVAAFYDAFLLYARAFNETLREESSYWNNTIIKGSEIVKRIYSKHIRGVTGNITINSNGDRDNTYFLWTLNPSTNMYEKSFRFYNNNMILIENRTIHWPNGELTPPKSEIKCGFNHSKCPDTSIQSTTVVCIILTCIVILLIIMSIVTYRHYKFEIDIASMTWKIHLENVEFISDKESKKKGSTNSFLNYGSQGEKLSMLADKQLFAPIGVYKGCKVAIKRMEKTKIELNRSLMVELKWMKDLENDHIVKFYGVCLEPSTIYLITEYISRGSLQDVLENEKIEIDKMFRTSLMHDIARGMCYLHASEIKSHGSLKSSNCLVDSRFVLKISDFGLQKLRQSSNEESIESESYWRKKLWTAPELLRMDHPPIKGTQKGDVYSFGIIIHEIEIRQGAFYLKNDDKTTKQIVESVRLHSPASSTPLRPHIEDNVEDEVVKLMKNCWSENAADRPDFPALKTAIQKLNKDNESGNLLDNLLSRMEQYANNLEALVDERTSDYLDQKRKCEELLYQLLPKSVASQLIIGQPVVAESYDQVTICFSDIVGFTSLSAESTPLQVVDFLNDLFTCFDSIIGNYDVYKIETIGDAYMVVSGLPVRNGTLHAKEIGQVCLALMKAVYSFKIRHKPTHQLRLRMGIHTGPCVAGVVGLKMPRYCLFGDTVNTASRMESSGEAMKIHVSSVTKSVLDTFGTFILELRGQIEIKGKGKMSTYWLNGENPTTTNSIKSSAPINIQQNIVTGISINNKMNTTVTIQVGTPEQTNIFSNPLNQ